MRITPIKSIRIQLSDEEIQTLENARKIVNEISELVHDEDCDFVSYNSSIYGTGHYSRDDLNELEVYLESLEDVDEIY